ncbi:MAG TPA: hypothetical protein PK398_02590 [Candidatus Gracilibacteria bacterium]|nr:hypothetical protein [Candidatus Gracilibacteria bacterium]
MNKISPTTLKEKESEQLVESPVQTTPDTNPAIVKPIVHTRENIFRKLAKIGVFIFATNGAMTAPGCTFKVPYDQNFDINSYGELFETTTLPTPESIHENQIEYVFDQYLSDIGFPMLCKDFLEIDETNQIKLKPGNTTNKIKPITLSNGDFYFEYTDQENRQLRAFFHLKDQRIDIQDSTTGTYIADAEFSNKQGQFAIRSKELNPPSTEPEISQKEIIMNSNGLICNGIRENGESHASYYNINSPIGAEIKDTESLLAMLKENEGYDYPFKSTKIDLRDIQTTDQLAQIYYYFTDKPESLKDFIVSAMEFEYNDKTKGDEYRAPIDSLKSGWGDCDDFVILTGLWGKMNGHKVQYIKIPKHVFTFIETEDNKKYIFDSESLVYFYEIDSLESYMQEHYPDADYTMTINP